MAETTLKICVLGPCKTGKTLLCRALAEQPIAGNDYHPTAAVRIQEVSRTLGVDRVKAQLWDCSGSQQFQPYWSVMAKDLDGVILVIDPEHTEQEKELEQFYMNFAQPNSLTMKQCMVLAIQVVKEGGYGLGGWQGLHGKLNKLQHGFVAISPAAPAQGLTEALVLVDTLLQGSLANKKELMERSVVDE